ncbi:HAD hydrolase, family IE [Aphanomyces invadans]|uniref:5'-nucleotidase n=1 Tax=Aphanomyces invadans TaxID=157072 RepID=A0A024UGP9_9STRA|nr:HAD hydrolase, family IE [Aphanomyces invadans]ETW05434.1 HAD hydrolase, family IE [Aphanomyces invadans]|eukprot:XP_008865211.1 HAD hydrolase, family IE [Aphanomyces invadans]
MLRSLLRDGGNVPAAAAAAAVAAYCASSRATSTARSESPTGFARQPPRAIISDPDVFAAKLSRMAADGPSQLLMIADFDYTLTPYYTPKGEHAHSCHGIISGSGFLGPEFQAKANALFQQFYPIEISPLLTHDEKEPHMIEWWERSHKIMVEYGLHAHHIQDAVADADITFRAGFRPLFASLATANVPTLIFSAGLADVIQAVMNKTWGDAFWTPNVHVISNVMEFEPTTGRLVGFQEKLIHCHNKNTAVVRDTPFWDECHSRRNVVLLGDSIGDVNMTEGLDGKEVLRIGFLNTHIEERMAEYLSLYDVVIVNDGTLHFAHVVVDLITRPPSPPRSVAEVPLAGL